MNLLLVSGLLSLIATADDLVLAPPVVLEPHERLVTVLATNDIHGAVESTPDRQGVQQGGLAFWAGAVSSVRQGLAARYGAQAGAVVVDAGDQFQGTLLSNYDEGLLMFQGLSEVGYDAVVPGNHDYDFGPLGWLVDQVTPGHADQNPRGALERIVAVARFPLISANTFFRASLRDVSGRALEVRNNGCRVESLAAGPSTPAAPADLPIDWSRAERPTFLQPYVIKVVAGVRVAMIGIDHANTPSMTTVQNVTDLCFADEAESYLMVRRELEGQADVFVLVMHGGDSSNEGTGSAMVTRVIELGGPNAVHAVAAGHTHFVHNNVASGVPLVQSGSSGKLFGRVDLIWDTQTRQVVTAKRRAAAGIKLEHAPQAAFEGVVVTPNAVVAELVGASRTLLDQMAKRRLGEAPIRLTRNRTDESLLANALTDVLRAATSTEASFMNTGGIRTDLPAGEILYEHLFEVLPFANRAVIVDLPIEKLIALLKKSITTCGAFGALMQSGLKVEFERDCTRAPADFAADPQARLVRVETVSGELLYANDQIQAPGRVLRSATLDFLASGGSGFTDFIGTRVLQDLGIARELMADHMVSQPMAFPLTIDGRWKKL